MGASLISTGRARLYRKAARRSSTCLATLGQRFTSVGHGDCTTMEFPERLTMISINTNREKSLAQTAPSPKRAPRATYLSHRARSRARTEICASSTNAGVRITKKLWLKTRCGFKLGSPRDFRLFLLSPYSHTLLARVRCVLAGWSRRESLPGNSIRIQLAQP